MDTDRTAGIRSLLRWIATLGQGNIVVERWRNDLMQELAVLEEGKERAA